MSKNKYYINKVNCLKLPLLKYKTIKKTDDI